MSTEEEIRDYLTANWPYDVPEECTAMVDGIDCLGSLPRSKWCKSCQTYEQLCGEAVIEEERHD